MRSYLLLATLFLILACGSNKSKNEEAKLPEEEEVKETLMWRADYDDATGKIKLTRDKPVVYDTLNVDRLIEIFNSMYPQIHIQLDRISNDTVYINIPDANYLTQQMGSTGPTVYFADVVFNFTDMPGIRYVSLNFEEGDHATPGVDSKESISKDYEPIIDDK